MSGTYAYYTCRVCGNAITNESQFMAEEVKMCCGKPMERALQAPAYLPQRPITEIAANRAKNLEEARMQVVAEWYEHATSGSESARYHQAMAQYEQAIQQAHTNELLARIASALEKMEAR